MAHFYTYFGFPFFLLILSPYTYNFAQNYFSFYWHQFHKRLTKYIVNKHVKTSDQQLLLVVILFLVATIQTNNALFRPSTPPYCWGVLERTVEKTPYTSSLAYRQQFHDQLHCEQAFKKSNFGWHFVLRYRPTSNWSDHQQQPPYCRGGLQ